MQYGSALSDVRPTAWLEELSAESSGQAIEGLVSVADYDRSRMRPEEVAIMEKAAQYEAQFVFFEARRNNRPSAPQAFIYVSLDETDTLAFADLHRRLWNWGGVPLVYQKSAGLVRLFRCAHKPDFFHQGGLAYRPHKILDTAATIADQSAWWDSSRLVNGTLWDDPKVCEAFLAADKSAHRKLVRAVGHLNEKLNASKLLTPELRRRLLILSLLIAYLEAREVLKPEFFASKLPGASRFFQVLREGPALVNLLENLKEWFNGDVFDLSPGQQAALRASTELGAFADLIEGHQEPSGQLSFWELYSFKDLPVELISEIYQLFVEDGKTAVYTPPALVRLILEEALSTERMQRLLDNKEVVLDPACGSGVFLVEAYKRLVLHWRSRNAWAAPSTKTLRELIALVHGIDVEPSAIELTNFSLCLAMCDALKPRDIQKSVKLFPELYNKSLHQSCFFEAKARAAISARVGVVVGNPPFISKLKTEGARREVKAFKEKYGSLPDAQLAYLFLHGATEIVTDGGLVGMIQPASLLYNDVPRTFRRRFFDRWEVREVLDFVSVRGMFDRDTKVVVLLAEARPPTPSRKVLHAVFRRNGRVDAEQSFDIDYYDLHWLPVGTDWSDRRTWRAGLLGGGRVTSFVNRLRNFGTLRELADIRRWKSGQGFIYGKRDRPKSAAHIYDRPLIKSLDIGSGGEIKAAHDSVRSGTPIADVKSEDSFRGPILLFRKQEDLGHGVWTGTYAAFADEIVGVSAPRTDLSELFEIDRYVTENDTALQAFVAATSARLFHQKATSVGTQDLLELPVPPDRNLDISEHERIIAEDIVQYLGDFVRLGDGATALQETGHQALSAFNAVFAAPINAIYTSNPLAALPHQAWPGIICQPFVFGDRGIDWAGVQELRGKIDALLREQHNQSLSVTRIARIYDHDFIFLVKPDRLRFWLRSVALRDSDDVLADLRMQGF